MGIRARCSFCNDSVVSTYALGVLDAKEGHVLLDVLNNLDDLCACLEVLDQLLPNGLADRWVELLEL